MHIVQERFFSIFGRQIRRRWCRRISFDETAIESPSTNIQQPLSFLLLLLCRFNPIHSTEDLSEASVVRTDYLYGDAFLLNHSKIIVSGRLLAGWLLLLHHHHSSCHMRWPPRSAVWWWHEYIVSRGQVHVLSLRQRVGREEKRARLTLRGK